MRSDVNTCKDDVEQDEGERSLCVPRRPETEVQEDVMSGLSDPHELENTDVVAKDTYFIYYMILHSCYYGYQFL